MFVRQFLQRIPRHGSLQLLNAQEGVFLTKAIQFKGKKDAPLPPSSPEIKLNRFPATQPAPKEQNTLHPPPPIGAELEFVVTRDERDHRNLVEKPDGEVKNIGSLAGLVEFLRHPSIWSLNHNYFNIVLGLLLFNYLFWIGGGTNKPHDVSHEINDEADNPKPVENVMDHSMD